MKTLRYLFVLLAVALLLPQQSLATMSTSYNPITKQLSFISDSYSDCDSSTDTYYLQTYIMTAPGPYYSDPNSGMPIPDYAWWSLYVGGSFVAPYTDIFDASTLLPGTYYAFVTCLNTQVNPSEYVPAHTPLEFTVTAE